MFSPLSFSSLSLIRLWKHGRSVISWEVNTPDPTRTITYFYPRPISTTYTLHRPLSQPSSCCYHPHCTLITMSLLWLSCFLPSSPFAPSFSPPPSPSPGQERPGRAMCFQSGLDRKSKQGFCVYQATAPSPCSYSRLEAPANW